MCPPNTYVIYALEKILMVVSSPWQHTMIRGTGVKGYEINITRVSMKYKGVSVNIVRSFFPSS